VATVVYDAAGNVLAQVDQRGNRTSFAFDALNRVTQQTDALNNLATTLYDAAGNVAATVDQRGNRTSFAYDALNRLTQQTDALNNLASVVYDATSNVIARVDQRGNRTSFAYDALNRRTQTTDALNDLSTVVYDAASNVVAAVDPRGNRTSYAYDALNRVSQVSDPAGGLATTLYDPAGNVSAQIDPLGFRTSFAYDALNRRTQITDALGNLGTVVFDAASNVIAQVDQRGNRTSFAYDALNRLTQQTDALNNLASVVYDAASNVIARVDQRGNRTSFAYDALNRRTQTTDALNDLSTVVYDAAGNVVNTIDALGNKGTFSFDALNRRVTSTNPLGFTTTTAYDAASNVVAVTNPRGYTTSFAYDALNRPTQTTDALNDLATTVYDAASNVLAQVDARGNRTSFGYDGLNRAVSRTDALNHTTSTAYDLGGNVVRQIDALGNATTMAYDGLHRRTSVQDPGGGIASTVYDATSNVVNTIDPVGNKTTFAYDALNRRTQTIDARGGITSTLYDATSNVTGMIDSVGNRSTFAYDALNRQTQETDPFNKSLTYAYDAIGRLTSQTDRLGRRENFSYDAGNRLTGATWLAVGGGTADTFTLTYDANNNQLTAANSQGTYTLTYDALDRVKTTQQPFGFGQTFTYDAVGNRTLVQDSFGATLTSVYDAVNRLTSRQVGGTGVTQMREDFTYTARDQVATATRYSDAAGTQQVGVSSYTYDAAARLTNLQNGGAAGMVSNFTYSYDLASRVTSETRNGSTVSYSYDAVNQLTNDGTTAFSYDLNGNRTMTGYQTGTANQMTNDGVYTYTFDAEGNVTKKSKGASADTWTYSYNNANQLVGLEDRSSDGGVLQMKATYTYDANGNRLESDVWTLTGGTTAVTRYAYDGWKNPVDGMNRPYSPVGLENWDVAADLSGSSSLTTRYLRGDGIDSVLARTDATGLEWLQTDRQGSVRDVVSNAGVVLDHLDYTGFGAIKSESVSSLGGRYKYTGAEADAETGLVFDHARYYDPATGRWLEQDPKRFGAGDPNLYRYVGNDPTNAADPSGRWIFLSGDRETIQRNVLTPLDNAGVNYDLRARGETHFVLNIDINPWGTLFSAETLQKMGKAGEHGGWYREALSYSKEEDRHIVINAKDLTFYRLVSPQDRLSDETKKEIQAGRQEAWRRWVAAEAERGPRLQRQAEEEARKQFAEWVKYQQARREYVAKAVPLWKKYAHVGLSRSSMENWISFDIGKAPNWTGTDRWKPPPNLNGALEKSVFDEIEAAYWADVRRGQPEYAVTAAPPEPLTEDDLEREEPRSPWDDLHDALNGISLIPGLGAIADLINSIIYFGERRYVEGGVCLAGMVPLLGYAVKWKTIGKAIGIAERSMARAAKVGTKSQRLVGLARVVKHLNDGYTRAFWKAQESLNVLRAARRGRTLTQEGIAAAKAEIAAAKRAVEQARAALTKAEGMAGTTIRAEQQAVMQANKAVREAEAVVRQMEEEVKEADDAYKAAQKAKEVKGRGAAAHDFTGLGDHGERLAIEHLKDPAKGGYEFKGALKNNSGDGLDAVFVKDGWLYIAEIKTSEKWNFQLSSKQVTKGPLEYAKDQVAAALKGEGRWSKTPLGPATKQKAADIQDLLQQYEGKVKGLFVKVPESGIKGEVIVEPWVAKP
jgi:RHS repeat-associated protein